MADPTGEANRGALRLDFDHRLLLQFRGSAIPSDAGLLPYRELDDAVGLTHTAANTLADARTGKNIRHLLGGLLRQSVFGRLAGYEDVNDADRLCRDPAMRWVTRLNPHGAVSETCPTITSSPRLHRSPTPERFVADSPLERAGFEPSVPRRRPSAPSQILQVPFIPAERCRGPQEKRWSYRRLRKRRVRGRWRDKRSRDTDLPEPARRRRSKFAGRATAGGPGLRQVLWPTLLQGSVTARS